MKQIDFYDEIIVDNFAGGGGASTGIEMAIGRSVDIAINHDPAAIAMHKVNHPSTEHYCESVWDINPVKACKGRKVGLAWFSPDCKHFSKAKGKKPVEKKIRGLAWVELRWAARVRPRVMITENVPEFITWGPIRRGKPIKSRQGETFNQWVKQLRDLGYVVEWKELIASDYGAPTTRRRLFVVARCDGQPIIWPKPTHGDPNSEEVKNGELKPWVAVSEIIDWNISCPSIFTRKKPLVEKTMRRLARGLDKFVINNPEPFIMSIGQTGFTIDRSRSIHDPLNTIVTKAEACLIAPTLIQYHSETSNSSVRGQSLKEPIMTIDGSPRYAINATFLAKYYGQGIGQTVESPLGTIVSKDKFALVTVTITKVDSINKYGYWDKIRVLLNKYCGYNLDADDLLLICIDENYYFISDIGLRMLQAHELFAAQGFPKTYIIDKDFKGKKYPKTAQVARCGNAVPPPFANALVRANLPEVCDSEDTGRYYKVV